MDQYPQEFRDRMYNQAALAHKHVGAGCDLYYRGSNSYHLKNMHHVVSESAHNHNHYRLANDKHYTPHDFEQHLRAFSGSPIYDDFFEEGEIDQLCGKFAEFHADWTDKINGQPSKEELYFQQASQRYNRGDMLELKLFGTMQEPCRLRADELKVDYQAARDKIERAMIENDDPALMEQALQEVERQYNALLEYRNVGGVRGLGSSKASTRQPEGSGFNVVKEQVMDDKIGLEVPDIPSWATSVQRAVDVGKQSILDRARSRSDTSRIPIPESDESLVWERKAEQQNYKLVMKELLISQTATNTEADTRPEQDDDSPASQPKTK